MSATPQPSNQHSSLDDDACPLVNTATFKLHESSQLQHSVRTTIGIIPTPLCHNLSEQPSAIVERARLNALLRREAHAGADAGNRNHQAAYPDPLLTAYVAHGLAYTVGSALGHTPPPSEATCLAAFLVPNKAHLTAGARAWSKHAHRSGNSANTDELDASLRWWGTPSGPVARINARAEELFWRVWRGATWRNMHWLPHRVLVYEIRIPEGYGMRWAQNWAAAVPHTHTLEGGAVNGATDVATLGGLLQNDASGDNDQGASADRSPSSDPPWIFRGFVEPMMENGHELGWRH